MKLKFALAAALPILSVGFLWQTMTMPVQAASASLAALDPDNDGTVDLAEAKAAGAKLFTKLDPDKDGTLDAKELTGRVDEAGLKSSDPDADGTLDEKEFSALIETRFKAADPDNDGTVDAAELSTDAGKALLTVVE